jgi:hypothetical protein
MPERPHEPPLTDLERSLLTLAPAPPALDRDRLLFEAGRRSARGRRLWPCATAALALVSAALGAAVVLRPAPPPVVQVITRDRPAPPPPTAAASSQPADESPAPGAPSYFQLQEQLLTRGLDGLPELPPPPAVPPETLEHLLGMPRRGSPESSPF